MGLSGWLTITKRMRGARRLPVRIRRGRAATSLPRLIWRECRIGDSISSWICTCFFLKIVRLCWEESSKYVTVLIIMAELSIMSFIDLTGYAIRYL